MTYCNKVCSKNSYNYSLLILLFGLWICGTFLGCCCGANAATIIPPLVHNLVVRRASFVGMLISVFLPLLLTILFSHFSLLIFLPVLSLVKAFAFSFTTCCVFYTFGSSSWLLQIFLLFSDSIAVILLFWIWIDVLMRRMTTLTILFTFFAIIGVVCAVDYFAISPFLISLLHF